MVKIKLTQGKTALIDDDDADMVSRFKWRVQKDKHRFYAMACIPQEGRPSKDISLHRLVMRFPKNEVDHINGDGLDCQKHNLREATKSQNQRNRRVNANSGTGIKGVSLRNGKYCARISADGKLINLGTFDTAAEAAKAYDVASLKFHGEFGRRNVVD